MKFAIACGGTGGHTFPGLATGRALLARGHEVEVFSAGREIEGSTLKGWDGPVFGMGAPKSSARHPLAFTASVRRTLRHLRANRPDALLAMGSYASLPPVIAARILGIPIVLHEANAVPGKAIAFLSRLASAIAITFPGTERHFSRGAHVVLTGLPVRTELLDQPPFALQPSDSQPATIFITGGSQGAYEMNRRVAEALATLVARPGAPRFRVIHQTGNHEDAVKATRRRYAEAGIEAIVEPFITTMGGAYKVADLVIARAGAATCAEIALFGKPALFIPLPTAVRDHQFLNAKHLANGGAALVMRQEDCAPAPLADAIGDMLASPSRLTAMSEASKALAAPDAATRLAELLEKTPNN